MYYVYVLRSCEYPKQTYVGYSSDLKQRLAHHNDGKSPHTSKFKPWKIAFYCAFETEEKAKQFEAYLKSHSGKAFASKRLL